MTIKGKQLILANEEKQAIDMVCDLCDELGCFSEEYRVGKYIVHCSEFDETLKFIQNLLTNTITILDESD